jgi:hypothetical protein
MSLMPPSMAALILGGAMMALAHGSEELSTYLVEKDGQKALKEPLTLREEQGGIAGITGTMWVIEPSGQWRVVRFSPHKDGTEKLVTRQSGKLTPEQLTALAKSLASRDLVGLPEMTGRENKINRHCYILKFGQKTATLAGVPPRRNLTITESIRKAAPAKEQADAAVWDRFAHLAQAVETCCKTSGQP